jgi:hypothetical protein
VTRGERACRAYKVFGAANPHEGHNHREVIVGSVPDANVIFRHFTENAQQIPAFGTNGLQRLGFVARGYFLFLLSIFACRRAGRIDARCPRRIHAERNAHRHSRLQISNARSLTVHSDLSELCNRERPGRVLVAYSNRVTSYA